MSPRATLALVLGLLVCRTGLAADAPAKPVWGARVAAAARHILEEQPPTPRGDCSGLVEAILAKAGAAVSGSSQTLWQEARRAGRLTRRPRPGDLAFFDRTYDADGNGEADDLLTHVAVVIAVEKDGTIVAVHRAGGRIGRLRLNLRQKNRHALRGRVLNDYLGATSGGAPGGERLAGQLVHGFARPPPPVPPAKRGPAMAAQRADAQPRRN